MKHVFHCRNLECLNLLLNTGADFNRKDSFGRCVYLYTTSVIHYANVFFFILLILGLDKIFSSLGHLCTTQLQTATTSACLLWWVQEPMSMSWTRGAAPPSTTPLLLTQMESELPYALWLSWMGNFKANEFTSASHSIELTTHSPFILGAWNIC